VIDGELTSDVRAALQAAIDEGRLPGVLIDKVAQLGVAGSDGVSFVSEGGSLTATAPVAGGTTALTLVSGVDDGTQLWAPSTDDATGNHEVSIIAVSGDQAKDGPGRIATFQLPGAGSRIVYDNAAELVEVLGATPDGTGTTVYVVEPHGRSVFADHRLPFVPAAMVLDHNEDYPTSSRGEILTFAADGATASIDIGHYPFAWRLPGVLLGALTAAVVYLLARVLFRRREVAVLAGLFVLLDGMFFVQSRIAMNDVYTGAFILSAYLLFAWLWLEPRRRWAFWTLMPVVGLLLGLALASKWVAAYAIGALGILVLARSALGRLILIAGLIGLTGVLGWMALAVPPDSAATGNLLFALIMIGLTLGAVAVTVYHPIAWSAEETWLAVAGPAALGIIVFLGSVALGGPAGSSSVRSGDAAHAALAWSCRPRDVRRVQVAGRWDRPVAPTAPRRRATGSRRPARRGVAAARIRARPADRLAAGLPDRDPAGRVRDLVRPLGADREPPADRGRVAAGTHRPDPHRPYRRHVPVPQQPDGGPRRKLAVVGLAAQPQARLVLPGELRELDGGGDLRRRQHGHLVAGHPGHGVRRLAGVPTPEPAAGADPDRVPGPVGLVGPDRPGGVPVPLLHEPGVRDPGARLLRGRAVARRVAPHVVAGPDRGRGRADGPGDPVAAPDAALPTGERRGGQPGLGGVPGEPRQPCRHAVGGGDGHRCAGDDGGAGPAAARPRPAARRRAAALLGGPAAPGRHGRRRRGLLALSRSLPRRTR
jgi:hypothetical protein